MLGRPVLADHPRPARGSTTARGPETSGRGRSRSDPVEPPVILRFDACKRMAAKLGTAAAKNPERTLAEMDGFRAKADDPLTARTNARRAPAGPRAAAGRQRLRAESVRFEAGTRVACISWAADATATRDTHGNNFGMLWNDRPPRLDAAYSSLVTDPVGRGCSRGTWWR